MGHEIVYCATCQIRLSGPDFENRKAFRVGLTICCAKCLDATLAAADPADAAAFRGRNAPAETRASTVRIRLAKEIPTSSGKPLRAFAGAALLVLGLGLAVFFLKPQPPPTSEAPPPSGAKEVAPAPRVVEAPRPAPPVAETWADLERRAKALENAEEFRAAAAVFENAKGFAEGVVDRRVAEVRRKAEALFAVLPRDGEAKKRVARWGYPDLLERLEREGAAAAVAPEPPAPPSPEARRYAAAWTAAMRSASARRFDEALATLEAASKGVAEAVDDLALLREVKALHEAGLRAFAALAPGASVTLRVYAPEDAEKSGVVRRAGPRRLELEGGDYVEADALTSRALAGLAGATPRATSAAALLDGEAVDGLPAKYAEHAREAAALRPRPDAATLAARARFYEAERHWLSEERQAEAVTLYRDLLREELLKDEHARIKGRCELPKDVFIPARQLRGTGHFRFMSVEKAESAWVCSAAGDIPGEHVVELAFPTLPDSAYKLWVHVGGCCAENFAFSWQVDELVQPVRHGILFLKRTHASHGGPREPKRWEWVALPLPKFPAAGLKRVRLVSGQQGFAVAAAQLSSTRTAPPGDAETKEQLRKAAPPSKPVEPDLVAWWKLDEGRGSLAIDASGRGGHGTLTGAQWRTSDGRAGLYFDGTDDALWTPTAALDAVEDTFTTAFWARPEAERASTPEQAGGDPTGTKDQRYVVFPSHGGDSPRAGVGVSVGRNGVSVFEHATAHMPSLLVHDAPISGWAHVAVVVEKRTPRLYLDGVLVKTGQASLRRVFASGQVSVSDYGRYAGGVADLRVWKRALSEAEIRAVCGRGQTR